ncbi:MAG: murein biosynthesis integral membrane protein MurJ [Candidatus Gastranaerophilales bacterium]|nr:murein biosynthesis integral membrane protein MurJ [Candidatus Gastranaerophilales bacterium]
MTGKSLFKIAGLIAFITIISKLVGFGRDVVIAHAYGATVVSDAYFYAYQIPSFALILLGGLGGPFHTATIAVFSKIIPDLNTKPPEEAQKLLNRFISITGVFFLILSILIFLFSDEIIKIIAANATPELQNLASAQLKIMSPMMFIGSIVGILYGISNVYNEFLYTSLSPTIASIAVIIGVLIFRNDKLGMVLAWGTLIGAVGQLILQLPVFFKSGFKFKIDFGFIDEKLVKIKEILFPAMLGTTIGQINIYVDMFFASQLIAGAWSAVGYANRIFQFPVGIIITAMLVPLFPMFSTFVGKKDWDSLRYYFHKGLSSLWFMSFPILAFIIIFAQDTIQLVLERGKFDHADTIMVSWALIYLTLSIVPYVARDTLTRIFYAFDDSKTPFYVATFSIIIKVIMNFLFVKQLGIGAITLSTTAITLVNAVLLAIFIRKKINLEFKNLLSPTFKIIMATLAMSAIAVSLKFYLDSILSNSTIFLATKLLIQLIVCTITYFSLAIIFRIHAARQIFSRIKQKLFKSSAESVIAE